MSSSPIPKPCVKITHPTKAPILPITIDASHDDGPLMLYTERYGAGEAPTPVFRRTARVNRAL
jgi:hypothetical protein